VIIGVSGYARSGKDTVADILVNDLGYIKISWADKLRECLYALNPIILWDKNVEKVHPAVLDYMPLQWIIDTYGWDGYKSTGWYAHIRIMLQRFGTEVGRQIINDNIWVDLGLKNLDKDKNYVIPDTRFLNEAESIRGHKGLVFRVNRNGVKPVNDHVSEIGLDDYRFDVIFNNNGSIEDLREKVIQSVETQTKNR